MDPRLAKAINNNNGIYETVFNSRGLSWEKTDALWYSLEKAPPFYSNLVTRSPKWRPEATFEEIDTARGGEWSMKDSFAELDMTLRGMRKLFDAEWLYLSSKDFTPQDGETGLTYRVLTDETELPRWFEAWDRENAQLGKEIFHSKLLTDPAIHFIGGYRDDEMIIAALLNETDDVMGLSNFFPPQDDPVAYWSEMIAFIEETYGPIDIVGYERSELMEKLKPLGIESVGNLAVWIKG